MLFAFFHELGHLFTGLFLGFKPYSLGINPLGLSINFEINARDYNKKVIKGNMIALKKLIISLGSKEFLVYANILIGLFNLIPIYPLDGGRILKNVLHILTGLESTYSYTNLISNISIIILTMFSSICILYLKNIAVVLIVGYLWYLVINENKLYNQRMKIYEIIKETM